MLSTTFVTTTTLKELTSAAWEALPKEYKELADMILVESVYLYKEGKVFVGIYSHHYGWGNVCSGGSLIEELDSGSLIEELDSPIDPSHSIYSDFRGPFFIRYFEKAGYQDLTPLIDIEKHCKHPMEFRFYYKAENNQAWWLTAYGKNEDGSPDHSRVVFSLCLAKGEDPDEECPYTAVYNPLGSANNRAIGLSINDSAIPPFRSVEEKRAKGEAEYGSDLKFVYPFMEKHGLVDEAVKDQIDRFNNSGKHYPLRKS